MSDFQLKFQEQIDFLQQKVNLPTQSYREISSRQHDRAFVVAGAMKADLLNDLHQAVNQAIAEGQTLKQFQEQFDTILSKNGWLEDKDKGYTAWRAKTIYQTNLRTSHAAGRYRQMTDPEVVKRRPYWRYRHNTQENPRVKHQKWNNLVLPVDDPFWKINFPPNGWGCNCTVDAINERQLKAMGKTKADASPTSFDDTRQDFNSAPGASWHPDLNKYPETIAKAYVANNMKDGVFERWLDHIDQQVQTELQSPHYDDLKKIKVAEQRDEKIKQRLRQRISNNEQYPIATLNAEQKKLLNVSTQVILFSHFDAVKQAYSRDGNIGFDHQAYFNLQHLIDEALIIIREQTNMSVWIETTPKENYLAVLQQTKTGKGLFLKSFRRSNVRDIERAKKRGTVLYERKS